MANANQKTALNVGVKGHKMAFLRLADEGSGQTTDYSDIIVGDGAPSGAYGRASGTTLVYLRKDASYAWQAMYLSVDGGTTWGAVDGVLRASGTIAAGATAGNLDSSPQTIVAAPGAGAYIEVQSIHWFLDYGTAAYDGTKTGSLMAK